MKWQNNLYACLLFFMATPALELLFYGIKHYKPSFRLRDLDDIDVDFNDPVWLMIADDNEGRPFFQLRKLWRKYVSGENIT